MNQGSLQDDLQATENLRSPVPDIRMPVPAARFAPKGGGASASSGPLIIRWNEPACNFSGLIARRNDEIMDA
jgi:hypothetical protein